jgi:pyruvate,water dikinase
VDRVPAEPARRDQAPLARLHQPKDFFVEKLAEGVSTIAAAFWPKPVIVRLSDFKSNEYRKLLGGEIYEPEEENPMLGFRGASRYVAPSFRDCFELECRAMKKVRDDMGLTNVRDHGAVHPHRGGRPGGGRIAGDQRPEARRERSEV